MFNCCVPLVGGWFKIRSPIALLAVATLRFTSLMVISFFKACRKINDLFQVGCIIHSIGAFFMCVG